MNYPKKKRKKILDKALKKLEELDLSKENNTSFLKKIESLKKLIRQYKTPHNSDFFDRFATVSQKGRWYFFLEKTEPDLIFDDFLVKRGPYKGISGRSKIYVNPILFSVYLSKTYKPKDYTKESPSIALNWRFNAWGQIQTLEASFYRDNTPITLLKVKDFWELEPDWREAEVELRDLSEQVRIVDPKILSFPYLKRYRCLVAYGHRIFSELIQNLLNQNTKKVDTNSDFLPLETILNNEVSRYMVQNVSDLNPIIPSGREQKNNNKIFYNY